MDEEKEFINKMQTRGRKIHPPSFFSSLVLVFVVCFILSILGFYLPNVFTFLLAVDFMALIVFTLFTMLCALLSFINSRSRDVSVELVLKYQNIFIINLILVVVGLSLLFIITTLFLLIIKC